MKNFNLKQMEFSLSKILFTVGLLWLLRFIYKFFVRPYLLLQDVKRLKGAVCVFRPFFGVYPEYDRNFVNHNDFFYTTKKRLRENEGMRFLATPLMENLTFEVYDPELVKEFTAKAAKSFEKDLRVYGVMPDLVRTGIGFTEQEKWKYQRKMLSQIFHFDYMNACIPLVNRISTGWVARYCKDQKSVVEVNEAFKMYAAEIVFNVFFGEDSFYTIPNAKKAVLTALKVMEDMLKLAQSPQNLIFGPRFIDWKLGKREREYISDNRFLREYFTDLLYTYKKKYESAKASAQSEQKPWKTLIECLLEEAPKSGLSEKDFEIEMLSEILTFFLGGIDTTSNSLAMAQYYLSLHPEIQDKLRDEINTSISSDEPVTRDHIMNLPYLNAVYKEILRLSPPASILLPRRALEDVTLGDLKVKKDSSVMVSIVGVHHNPSIYPNPEVFNPDRWLEKTEAGTSNPYAAIPFSIGQRKCIGEQLALIEAKTMIIEIVRKFRVSLKQPFTLKIIQTLTYQHHGPMDIIFERIQEIHKKDQ